MPNRPGFQAPAMAMHQPPVSSTKSLSLGLARPTTSRGTKVEHGSDNGHRCLRDHRSCRRAMSSPPERVRHCLYLPIILVMALQAIGQTCPMLLIKMKQAPKRLEDYRPFQPTDFKSPKSLNCISGVVLLRMLMDEQHGIHGDANNASHMIQVLGSSWCGGDRQVHLQVTHARDVGVPWWPV